MAPGGMIYITSFVTIGSGIQIILSVLPKMVSVPGYRFRGPGSIPGTTRFFLRSGGSGTGSTQPPDDN
jgi:hypothetical protein